VRLVENQEVRLVQQRPAERQPLQHAARKRTGARVPRIPEAKALEQHACAFAPLGHPVETPVEIEVLERSQLPVDERLVCEVADASARNAELELPARGCGEPGAETQQRRLPRPVRPGDDQEVVGADVELDAAQDPLVAVTLLERAGADHNAASASTKAKNTTLMTPLTVKNAASSRRTSLGRTSECS
jgi:hypothetical protein